MSVKAGDLNRRVKILERRDAAGKVGPSSAEWVEIAGAWAMVSPVKYLKAALYKSLSIEGNAEVVMRRKDWLTAAHRISIGGVVYAIVNVATNRDDGSTTALLKTVDKLDGR